MHEDPLVFGSNVKAFRLLRGWSVRELAQRAGLSTRTITKVEHGYACTTSTERKLVRVFNTSLGRLWDGTLLSRERQRVIDITHRRWFFSETEDALRYHRRLAQANPELAIDRPRDDPDEIQDDAERRRLGHAGLARAFMRIMGGSISAGYFQFNQGELYRRDHTPPDGVNLAYLCYCVQGGIRIGVRSDTFELPPGDAMVFEAGDGYWLEPLYPVEPGSTPAVFNLNCLRLLNVTGALRR